MVIKPTKLIKGQRIENMMDETNIRVVGINEVEAEGTKYQKIEQGIYVEFCYHQSPWYQYITHLLDIGIFPQGMEKYHKRSLKLIDTKYHDISAKLNWRNPNELLLKCMIEEEEIFLIIDMHQGIFGGMYFVP